LSTTYVLVFPVVFSFWLSHQYPICILLLPHSCYIPWPCHHPCRHQITQNKLF
jgi:hypothetical protein